MAQARETGAALASQSSRVNVKEPWASGGTLTLDVNAGNVRIIRNLQAGQLRLEIAIESLNLNPAQAQERWVKRVVVEGTAAAIALRLPSDRAAGLVRVYVPAETALVVKMHAGGLIVSGIKGNKDLRVGSGALTLREADPSDYQHVRAEVKAGQLTDGVFGGKQSGLVGRVMVSQGKGSYDLLLHVGTGNLVLTHEDGSQ